jgi:hypothetical protein
MRTWAGGGATAGRPPRPRRSLGSTGFGDTRYKQKKKNSKC